MPTRSTKLVLVVSPLIKSASCSPPPLTQLFFFFYFFFRAKCLAKREARIWGRRIGKERKRRGGWDVDRWFYRGQRIGGTPGSRLGVYRDRRLVRSSSSASSWSPFPFFLNKFPSGRSDPYPFYLSLLTYSSTPFLTCRARALFSVSRVSVSPDLQAHQFFLLVNCPANPFVLYQAPTVRSRRPLKPTGLSRPTPRLFWLLPRRFVLNDGNPSRARVSTLSRRVTLPCTTMSSTTARCSTPSLSVTPSRV